MEKMFRNPEDARYPQKIYASQLITIDDLQQFKRQLLDELIAVLKTQTTTMPKKWIKSHEVLKLLKISPGTLQTLKASGAIVYTKIGGIHYYDYEDILRTLETGKNKKI